MHEHGAHFKIFLHQIFVRIAEFGRMHESVTLCMNCQYAIAWAVFIQTNPPNICCFEHIEKALAQHKYQRYNILSVRIALFISGWCNWQLCSITNRWWMVRCIVIVVVVAFCHIIDTVFYCMTINWRNPIDLVIPQHICRDAKKTQDTKWCLWNVDVENRISCFYSTSSV